MQKTEHYCIAAWARPARLASRLEASAVVKSMERALQEGRQLDEALTKLAEGKINPQLFGGEAGEEDEGSEADEEEDEEEDEDEDDSTRTTMPTSPMTTTTRMKKTRTTKTKHRRRRRRR